MTRLRTTLLPSSCRRAWRTRTPERLGRATFCRAGFAGRGMTFGLPTERHTLASDSDPRRSLGSAPYRRRARGPEP